MLPLEIRLGQLKENIDLSRVPTEVVNQHTGYIPIFQVKERAKKPVLQTRLALLKDSLTSRFS